MWVFGPWWLVLLVMLASRDTGGTGATPLGDGSRPHPTGLAGRWRGFKWRIKKMPELGAVNQQGDPVPWVAQIYISTGMGKCGGETTAWPTADDARAWIPQLVALAITEGAETCSDESVEWPTPDDLPDQPGWGG